jgi:hypothetical protein
MQPMRDEADVFVFSMWQRAEDSAEWLPTSRLSVHVDDGGSVVPVRLSWATEDGAQSAVGFTPDMTSCYGHRRTADGDVAEVRGELAGRTGHPKGDGTRWLEFDAEAEDAGSWHPAGRLRVLIDDGSEAPVRWMSWTDPQGTTCSVALRSVRPSGNADVTDLVSTVWASAEHSAAGEVASNLVHPSGSKWLAWHNRASLEFRLSQPVVVDRYVLTSANDAPDRDPAAWVLRGSADGQTWRTLDTRSGQSFSERHQPRRFRITEPASCDRFRLDITGTNGSWPTAPPVSSVTVNLPARNQSPTGESVLRRPRTPRTPRRAVRAVRAVRRSRHPRVRWRPRM